MTLDHVLQLCVDLPTFPAVALKVVQACDDPDTNAHSLADLVAQDPALTTRLLRLANSSFFGMERRVKDLGEAIVVLGLRNVRHLSLVAATYGWMQGVQMPRVEASRIWIHSLGMGISAGLIADLSPEKGLEDSFTAGLLCEIGRVAFAVVMPEATLTSYDMAQCGATIEQAELQVFGFNHTHLGAALGESWGFPEETISAIRFHHNPNEGGTMHALAACCNVADYLATVSGVGYGRDGISTEVSEKGMEHLRISADDLDRIVDRFIVEFDRHESMCRGMHTAA